MQLRIGLVIRNLLTRSGGAERIYCELANMLADAGHTVICLYYDKKEGALFYPLSSNVERVNLFPKFRTRSLRWAHVTQSLTGQKSDEAKWRLDNEFFASQLHTAFLARKLDVAISLLPPANTVSVIASRGTQTRTVVCNHNVPKHDYESDTRWSQNPWDKKLRLEVLNEAAAVHVLFPSFAEFFPQEIRAKIFPIPNYVSKSLKPVVPAAKRKTIIAVGRLSLVKNFDALIREWSSIASTLPDWCVDIYGEGPLKEELIELARSLDVETSVRFMGVQADLSRAYSEASFMCHPAHFEGFGLVAAEALYCGTPVIAYEDCEGVNQIVKPGVNGLLPRRSTGNLSEAMYLLATSESLREKLSSQARASIGQYTFESYERQWGELLTRVSQ